jgi:hypothetical protein
VPSCARCHATTGVDDRYCMACGHRLGAPPEPVSEGPDPTDTTLPPVPARAVVDEPGLVACPVCGTANAGRRRRCGRCGAGLRGDGAVPLDEPADDGVARGSGEVAAWGDAADHPPARRGASRRGVGVAIAVVVLGILVGAGVGAAAGMGLGPFATVEAVAFDPDAYPSDPRPLRPATAGASSTATAVGDRGFGPEQTVDDDLATAWRSEGEGRGARLRHAFVAPVWLHRIEVAVGDQASDATFGQVGRATRVTVDLGTQRVEASLAAEQGVQLVELPEPVLVDQVTWEVTAVTGGRTVALSEVAYVGWRADEADQAAFRER